MPAVVAADAIDPRLQASRSASASLNAKLHHPKPVTIRSRLLVRRVALMKTTMEGLLMQTVTNAKSRSLVDVLSY